MTSPSAKRILLGLHWNYMDAFHEGAIRRFTELGWETRLLTTDTVERLAAQPFHGILGPLSPVAGHPVRRLAETSGVPLVEPTPATASEGPCAWFHADNAAVGRIAADYLRRLPVASFLFVSDCENDSHRARRASFYAALAGDARPAFSLVVPTGNPDAEAAFHALVKRQPGPVAIFGSIDYCAKMALGMLLSAGLSVPGDAYILGFGNLGMFSGTTAIPISSIDMDDRAWGYAAAGLLAELVTGRTPPGETRLFPPGAVIERASTIGVSAESLLCARAVALMRSRIADPLTVDGLATGLMVSKTKLLRLFSAAHGESLAAFYLKLRLDLAKDRLSAGEKASAVAASVGFDSYRAFGVAFKKHTGLNPREFALRA